MSRGKGRAVSVSGGYQLSEYLLKLMIDRRIFVELSSVNLINY
jgi:hypothetical protein